MDNSSDSADIALDAADAADTADAADAAAPVIGTPWSRLALAVGVRPGLIIAIGAVLVAMGHSLLWMNVVIIMVDVVTLALVHRLLRAEGRGLADLLRFRGADVGWGLLCGLIVLVAWMPASFIGNLIAYQGAPPASSYP